MIKIIALFLVSQSWAAKEPTSVFHDFVRTSNTYTAVASSASVDLSSIPLRSYGLLVYGNPVAASAWSINCEGSLDNVHFSTITTHASGTNGDGATTWSGASLSPSLYIRTRVTSLTLGSATNITAICLGTR